MMVILRIIVADIGAYTSLLHPSFIQQVISVVVGSLGLIFATILYAVHIRRLQHHAGSQVATVSANNDTSKRKGARGKQLSATKTIQFLLVYLAIT